MLFARTISYLCCGWLFLCPAWLLVTQGQEPAQPGQSPAQPKIYLIGNSLTWDTLPGLLDGDVQWHVDCGKNLKYIHDHPGSPCVKTSTLWPQAFKSQQYDLLSVQPHMGTSLAEDVAVISTWLKQQPAAILILHTGWSRAAEFEATYHAGNSGKQMTHAPEYFHALKERLLELHPGLEIRSTAAIDVLEGIYHDIEQQRAPFKSFDELYRDSIHMTTETGRYLMHNLMRIALGQPLSDQGFQLEPPHKAYLLSKLKAVQASGG
jgi:hypothetical protein